VVFRFPEMRLGAAVHWVESWSASALIAIRIFLREHGADSTARPHAGHFSWLRGSLHGPDTRAIDPATCRALAREQVMGSRGDVGTRVLALTPPYELILNPASYSDALVGRARQFTRTGWALPSTQASQKCSLKPLLGASLVLSGRAFDRPDAGDWRSLKLREPVAQGARACRWSFWPALQSRHDSALKLDNHFFYPWSARHT